MAVIGITGSIASGKSTFRSALAPLLPAAVLDADLLAKNLLEKDPEVRERVIRDISPLAYLPDGSPDRSLIRRIIYNNPVAKKCLESILHAPVRLTWLAAAASSRQDRRHLLIDIPLLFETGAEDHFDHVVVVACSPDVQQARLLSRGLDPEISRKIVAAQLPASEKIARASHVVWNDGSLSALDSQARQFAGPFNGQGNSSQKCLPARGEPLESSLPAAG